MLRVGLRAKLLLALLSLAAIPLVGVGYVREMESLLREEQEQSLLASARAIATALNDRPALTRLKTPDPRLARERREAIDAIAGVVDPPAASAAADPLEAPSTLGEDINAITGSINRAQHRVWVVDRKRKLLALTGSLKAAPLVTDPKAAVSAWERIENAVLQPFYRQIVPRPTENFDDSLPESEIANGAELERALTGIAATRRRATPDNRAVVVSAAHPVFAGDEVVAAVVVEETTNAVQTFTTRALEKLITGTLAAFAGAALVLLLLASTITRRILRLRDEAEAAVDARGRLTDPRQSPAPLAGAAAGDEIGDLSRSFSQLLARLAQHHDYMEQLGARLSHEFRTPIAVVRSSLENLAMQPLPADAQVYVRRAEEGVTRLATVLSRMSEARRVEAAIEESPRDWYDPIAVLKGCVEGYRAAFAGQTFELRLPSVALKINGAPDLLAQALDKLAANAAGFAVPHTPVLMILRLEQDQALLSVTNSGPSLPGVRHETLFDSMVSLRDGARTDGEPHLGLGLFIVRLVAEFHGGEAQAENLPDGSGVAFTLRMPARRV